MLEFFFEIDFGRDKIPYRTCFNRSGVRIFEHNFVDDKANFRRLAAASQENSTKSAAKFAEKTCANPIGTCSYYLKEKR